MMNKAKLVAKLEDLSMRLEDLSRNDALRPTPIVTTLIQEADDIVFELESEADNEENLGDDI